MSKKVNIEKSWYDELNNEFDKPYFTKLREFVRNEYRDKIIFPDPENIFRAFNLTPFNQVKVNNHWPGPLSWRRSSSWTIL